MPDKSIPFNKPAIVGRELELMDRAVRSGKISGNGEFSKKLQKWMEEQFGIGKVFLTTSCTDALEMAAMLLGISPGDEVIVPSFGFVSTANAFVSRGAVPVFVDIRKDTLNIDETLIEQAITSRTKAIVPIHYSGVAAQMDSIEQVAKKHRIAVVEDAAQGVGATFKGKHLGSLSGLAAYSFHETKNIHCGEGGALCVNDPALVDRAEIIWEKGTNRSKFFRGEIDKYTWVDIGSSFLMSDLLAAYLFSQFEKLEQITTNRKRLYKRYEDAFSTLENRGLAGLPQIPRDCESNAHIFYLILDSQKNQKEMIAHLRAKQIHAVFHYLPLHQSPMGKQFGGLKASCPNSIDLSSRLVRLPLYHELGNNDQDCVIESVLSFFNLKPEATE